MSVFRHFCPRTYVLYLIYITFFLLPLSPMFFYLSLVPAVFLAWMDRKTSFQCGPLGKWGVGFLLCSFLSIAVSPDVSFSLFNWIFEPCLYMAFYVLILTYIRNEEEQKCVLKAIFLGALCVVIWGIIQYADIGGMTQNLYSGAWVDPARFPLLQRRMFSTLENPNLFGAYLLMVISLVIPFLLKREKTQKKVLYFILLAFLLFCLALTYSRGAWVSALALVIALTIFYDKRFSLLFLVVALILSCYHGQLTERFISLFGREDTSVGLRMALWESTWAMVEEHPLLGIGWGAYWLAYPDYNFFIQNLNVVIYHAHNMYLQIPAVVGIPGAICYFVFFFGHGWIAKKAWENGQGFTKWLGLSGMFITLAMAVNGMADFVLFSRSISFYFWGLSALCISGINIRKEKENGGKE